MQEYPTGEQQAEANHRRLLANTWAGYESGRTTQFKSFKAEAEDIVKKYKRCSVNDLLDLARQGRAESASAAYQILMQDRANELRSTHYTDR